MIGTIAGKVLVLTGSEDRHQGLIDWLKSHHEVVVAHSLPAALAAMREGRVEAVFSDAGDFLPLERALAAQESGVILDTIGEGICATNKEGEILWSNRRMRQWSPAVHEKIAEVCRNAYDMFTTQVTPLTEWLGHMQATEPGAAPVVEPAAREHSQRSRKFSFNIDDKQYFEMFCSPVVDASASNPAGKHEITQIVAICWDATGGRRLQQKIDAIDQAGRELVRLEGEAIAKLTVGQRLKLLEEKIIKFCRQLMHFDHFAIRLLDRKTNKLEIVISVGLPSEAIEVELFAVEEGNGISGHVAATGRSYNCADVRKDPRYVIGLSHALSSLTVPLMLQDKNIGIFNIESTQPAAFTEDDRQFAEIFGRYVAVALNILNLLVVERHATAGQLASDVSAEIAAPLNDIVSETTLLIEDYLGDEELRRRLTQILDNVNKVRTSVRAVAAGTPATILGGNAPRAADPLFEGKRVLVADDEPNIRQTLADLLTRLGCNVDQAKDGAEACAFLAAQPRYDAVLSDIKMPHKNGYEIFAAAQKIGHNPPVILMTGFGYDPNHAIVRASQEGLAAVLFKPFKVDQLMAELRKALGAEKS